MRSGPSPALQNVLVARPGTSASSTAVIRRDDLLTAAVLAAEEVNDVPRSRHRNMLSALSRRWARISDSLRRRRPSSSAAAAQNAAAVAAVALASTEPRRAIEDRSDMPAAFDREQAFSFPPTRDGHLEREGTLEEEMLVSSMRETSSRRVRQVGAREDDDTLLMLPRVASVSFSSPDSQSTHASRKQTPRVRRLPRVSGLMPVRASRASAATSPTSSEENRDSLGSDVSGGDSGTGRARTSDDEAFSDGYASADHGDFGEQSDEEDDVDGDTDGSELGNRAFHRLPTGLASGDVEREMARAVVEIASDDDSEGILDVGEENTEPPETSTGDRKKSSSRGTIVVARSRSEMPFESSRRARDESQVFSAFSRRVSSSTHAARRFVDVEGGEAQPVTFSEQKSRFPNPHDCALFEDDYLSFQGFQSSHSEHRSHYQSVSALLRTKRISSVTDSHSEKSEESVSADPKRENSPEVRRKQPRRMLPHMLRMKRNAMVGTLNQWQLERTTAI